MERRSVRGESRGRDDDRRPSRDEGRDSGRDSGRRGGRDEGRGGSRFQYQARDSAAVRKRAESGGGKDFDQYIKSDLPAYKAKDKDNNVRFLPATWPDAEHYGLDIWVHYGIGADDQTYLCAHKMRNEPCPICEERARAQRSGDEDYAKELAPKKRVLVYLVDRDNERDGVHVWAMPTGLDTDIVQVSVDRKTGEAYPIDHPTEGYDVSFSKAGTGKQTKYTGAAIDRRESPLGKQEWLDVAVDHPLPEVLNFFPYDHIKSEFGGSGDHSERNDRRGDDRPERGGRDDRDSGRDSGDRGRSTSREPEQRSSRRSAEPELTWEDVQAMSGQELEALVEDKNLDVDLNNMGSDEELADAICDEMRLKQAVVERESRRGRDDDAGSSSTADRLRNMRRR